MLITITLMDLVMIAVIMAVLGVFCLYLLNEIQALDEENVRLRTRLKRTRARQQCNEIESL